MPQLREIEHRESNTSNPTTTFVDFEYDQNIKLICDACPEKTSPGKAKDVYAEHAHLVAERDRIKIPVQQAAQWLMGKALQYYQLVRETWGKDFKFCKTTAVLL